MTRKTKVREERVLAKPLIQTGVLKQPGETVRLRPDQIARYGTQGYFEAAGTGRGRKHNPDDGETP